MIICPYMDIKKLKKRVNFKKIVNFKKGIGIETQFTTVTLIMKKYLNKMSR